MKNLAGIRAKIEVDGPPNPKSSRNSDGSTLRDIKTLSTLGRFQVKESISTFIIS